MSLKKKRVEKARGKIKYQVCIPQVTLWVQFPHLLTQLTLSGESAALGSKASTVITKARYEPKMRAESFTYTIEFILHENLYESGMVSLILQLVVVARAGFKPKSISNTHCSLFHCIIFSRNRQFMAKARGLLGK